MKFICAVIKILRTKLVEPSLQKRKIIKRIFVTVDKENESSTRRAGLFSFVKFSLRLHRVCFKSLNFWLPV